MRRPDNVPPSISSTRATKRRRCRTLTSAAALSRAKSWPWCAAVSSRARMSLGRQEPPKPRPALRKARPMRGSAPMPSATACTSPPVSSHRWAISLMKLIFSARKLLAPYLISSALVGSVTMRRPGRCATSAITRAHATASSPPTTMRAGLRTSSSALPSRRNSGHTTSCGARDPRPHWRGSSRVVPGGTLLLRTMTAPAPATPAICSTAARTSRRSACPSGSARVPTATMAMPAPSMASATPSQTESAPLPSTAARAPSRPGSWIGAHPWRSAARRFAFASTMRTSRPASARATAVTSPTYPAPTTQTRASSTAATSRPPVIRQLR
jgi:hypothetical protein